MNDVELPPADPAPGGQTPARAELAGPADDAAATEVADESAPGLPRSTPSHAIRRPFPRAARIAAAAAGGVAAVAAAGLGTAALLGSPSPRAPESMHDITVSLSPPATIPLTDQQIVALLQQPPDYGAQSPLADPTRLATCLSGLDHPTATVLGARPIEINGRSGVLLLLSGNRPEAVAALVVSPSCGSTDHEVLAATVVNRG